MLWVVLIWLVVWRPALSCIMHSCVLGKWLQAVMQLLQFFHSFCFIILILKVYGQPFFMYGIKLALPILLGYVTEERTQIPVFICVLMKLCLEISRELSEKHALLDTAKDSFLGVFLYYKSWLLKLISWFSSMALSVEYHTFRMVC